MSLRTAYVLFILQNGANFVTTWPGLFLALLAVIEMIYERASRIKIKSQAYEDEK